MGTAFRALGFTLFLSAFSFRAGAEDITNAIHAFLWQRVEVEKWDAGLVVGLVDEQGSRVVSCGRMDNGTGQEVNGDTLFEIGSLTKTFTALLLQDMVERGEMKLDVPVAAYLPKSVTLPTRHGKAITPLHLATHTSGLPLLPDNLDPKRADNPYADYTVEKLNAFLRGYELSQDPGAKYEYSELGMELLGHVVALKAGTDYESLVVERICRPLGMDSTRVTLTPELRSRLATGHDGLGRALPGLEFQTLVGGSGLKSTANDLLKYVAANLGLTPTRLTPLMEKMHAVRFESLCQGGRMALGWGVVYYPQGRKYILHGGGTPGYTTFICFDKARRRGAVILSSSNDLQNVARLGLWMLESEWRPDRRPIAAKLNPQDYDWYAGEYRLSPNLALGMLTLRAVLANVTARIVAVGAGVLVAVVLVAVLLGRTTLVGRLRTRVTRRWRAFSVRRRRFIAGGVVLAGVVSAVLTPLVTAYIVYALAHPVVDIRREGDRLLAQATSSSKVASKVVLPHITGELWPAAQDRLFERVSGTPLNFSRDARGKVAGVGALLLGAKLSFVKTSDEAPEPPRPPRAIKLDPKFSDACVGQYEFPPDRLFPKGIKLAIRRQGERLVGQALEGKRSWGAFEVYPLSETDFYFTMTIFGVQLHFIKNYRGEVTSVIRHAAGRPDLEGKKAILKEE